MGNGGTAWISRPRRWIWLVAGVVVLALLVLGVVRALTAGAKEKPAAAATVAVDTGAVSTEVATTGTLQPAQTRSLSFTVTGTVASIAVRAGSEVTAGQELAKVDDTDAAATVATAQDALDQAGASLTEAKKNAADATSTTSCTGANVPAGYPTTSASASPPVSASPSRSAGPSAPPTRTVAPTPTPTRTQAPPPTTNAPRGGAAAPATSCAAGRQQQQNGQGGDAVLSAEQRVTQAGVTLQNAEDALEGTTITAPIAGRILAVSGQVGSQVGSGSTFITLADVYDMQISADFPEADADRLAVKQKAVVTLADRPGTNLTATVVQVDPVGTSDGTMVRYGVLLSFTQAPKDLLVGQSAAVRVTTGSATGVLRVPSTAVHDVAGDTATVLKSGAGATQVGVGLRGDQYTEITSGLVAGDTVVRSW